MERFARDDENVSVMEIVTLLKLIRDTVSIGQKYTFIHDDRNGEKEPCFLSHVDPTVGLRLTSLKKKNDDFTWCVSIDPHNKTFVHDGRALRILNEILRGEEIHWGVSPCFGTFCLFKENKTMKEKCKCKDCPVYTSLVCRGCIKSCGSCRMNNTPDCVSSLVGKVMSGGNGSEKPLSTNILGGY